MRFALVDDDETFLAQTAREVMLLLEERGTRADVVQFTSAAALLNARAQSGCFDVYFLDVVMPDMGGLELGRQIRSEQPDAPLVFLTTSSDYALQAIGLEVVDYVVKPFVREALAMALDRSLRRLSTCPSPTLGIRSKNGCVCVSLRDIVHVEASGRYQVVYVFDGNSHIALMSMQEFWEKLQVDSRFIRVGRQYIVNLAWVRDYKDAVLGLVNGAKINVPRRVLAEVRRAMLNYLRA